MMGGTCHSDALPSERSYPLKEGNMPRRCILALLILIGLIAIQVTAQAKEPAVSAAEQKAHDLYCAMIRSILADDAAGVNKCLEDGANANPVEGMPLRTAAVHGNIEIAKLLLTHGASPDPLNHCGGSPLFRAVFTGRAEMVKLLLDAGARQGLDKALRVAAGQEKTDVLLLLISAGADVNAVDTDGQTALHVAARKGRVESAKVLLQAGSDQLIRDHDGKRSVDYARSAKHPNVARILSANAAT